MTIRNLAPLILDTVRTPTEPASLTTSVQPSGGVELPDPVALAAIGMAPVLTSAVTSATKRRRHDPKALAKWPRDAHAAWRSLGKDQRNDVLKHMTERYGVKFAAEFYEATKSTALRSDDTHHFVATGPSEEKLRASGYALVSPGSIPQFWVHPSGRLIMKVADSGSGGTQATRAPNEIVVETKATVEGMKAWLDDVKRLGAGSNDYASAYTDFWVALTKERDDLSATLADPNLDADTRKGLEEQLKAIEDLNGERAKLRSHVSPPDGESIAIVDGWLYLL